MNINSNWRRREGEDWEAGREGVPEQKRCFTTLTVKTKSRTIILRKIQPGQSHQYLLNPRGSLVGNRICEHLVLK